MLAQRGSRPDDKSQRSVQLRAPTQAQLKSPTWGNEEDDGPMAHPTAGAVPAINRATAAPPALTTAPLDWTTPSGTLPRAPSRQGGPTRGGSPLRPRPSSGQRRKHLGSQRNGAHRPPWIKTRKPTGKGPKDIQVQTRTPPDPSGSDKTILVNGRAPAEGHTARATARVEQTQPQATATDPPAYQTQGRAKAHSRQGNPPRTKSNGSADCLNNHTTPSADRAHMPTKQGAQSGKAARQRVGRGADHTNTPLGPATWSHHTPTASHSNRATAALKAYQGTVRTMNGTGTRRDD
ncbi:hypothetical protein WOLCODRAFT_155168 [Wolfiporia cocos MD-104 SS10]|uniref:Uncharacterized protein n=1 Tax=Wolfiporia cocos (strain MD-104) TaxID=742152 RepID=A0A2H3JEU5_WOLCO|nr:hypothetical protein WOLCODRAFT_155168 [Wolfiporia cocos MD-104 SS10]